MKLKPLEGWLGDDVAVSYVALQADEDREGYISTRDTITSVFPFREHGVDMEDVRQILENAGLGMPSYYEWRTRSGCYFCFFQRKSDWVGLADRHPDLFEKAVALEQKVGHEATQMKGRAYTWSQGEFPARSARTPRPDPRCGSHCTGASCGVQPPARCPGRR